MTEPRPLPNQPLFYCSTLDTGADVVLTGDEVNHVKAQRLQPGDPIALFDGHGLIARGNVRTVGRREIRVTVADRRREPPRIPYVELYCAVPKGDRMSVLLDMATQLGMSGFTPVQWRRSVVEAGVRPKERWQRICIEACKQSRRLHVPEIAGPLAIEDAVTQARQSGASLIVAHPLNRSAPIPTPAVAGAERIALFVGPEGGLTDDELKVLQNSGAHLVSLGDAILRIEAAAVALIAAVNTVRAVSFEGVAE